MTGVAERRERGARQFVDHPLRLALGKPAPAERPDLVAGLVVAEASPTAANADALAALRETLDWPTPFPHVRGGASDLRRDTLAGRTGRGP